MATTDCKSGLDPISAPRQIPVARPRVSALDAECVKRAVESGWVSQGPRVAEFESTFAVSHGKRFGVACCSGTSALQLALAELGIGPADRVVVPTLTMVAVPNAVLYVGASPVFVDSEAESGNPDPGWVQRIVTERPSAVIVPHLYGEPAESFLREFHRELPNTPLIEDCAEAHYATFSCGDPVGTRSWAACFSFYANKIITSGEGGMVLTNDHQAAEKLRSLRAHAFTDGQHFHHQGLAYGMRMTDMQASLGLCQHGQRKAILADREAIAHHYLCRLKRVPWLEFPKRSHGSVWWVFPVVVARDAPVSRDALRGVLANAGVETRTYFHPMHRQPHLRRYATADYPVADDLAERGLYLPLFPDMTDEEVGYVCDSICSI